MPVTRNSTRLIRDWKKSSGLYALHMPEVDTFMKEYAPAFLLSLDEMNT